MSYNLKPEMYQTQSTERFTRSYEANRIIDFLKSKPIGAVANYKDIEEACGRDVRVKRSALDTAIKVCWDDGIFYTCVISVGYCRMSPDEAAAYLQNSNTRRSRSAVKRVLRKVDGIDPAELKTQEALQKFAMTKYVAHMQKAITDRAAEKKIAAHVMQDPKNERPRLSSAEIVAQMLASGFKG